MNIFESLPDKLKTAENINVSIAREKIGNGTVLYPEISAATETEIAGLEIINIPLAEKEIRFLRFGLNMPGDPVRFGRLGKNGIFPPPRGPDRHTFYHEDQENITLSNNSLAVFSNIAGNDVTLIGNATFKHAEGTIKFVCNKKSGEIRLVYCAVLDNLYLPAGTVKKIDPIVILSGNDLNALLIQWAEYTARQTTPRIPAIAPTGWNDWQYYREEKTQQDVLDSAEVIAEMKRRGYPLDFVQVDGGFCLHLSEWSVPKPGFSDGIQALSEKIRGMGLKFGLWLAPYIQNKKTTVVREHPEWLLLDKTGRPVELPNSNVGPSHLIDYSLDAPLTWLRQLVRMFADEWKVEWIKLDGPNYALYRLGRLRDNTMTITEMLARTFEIIREEAGPEILVEGEGMLGLALGKVDLHRVQTDNHTRWYTNNNADNIYAPQVYGKELIMAFLHNRWWCNHRENVVFRDFPSPFCHATATDPDVVEQMFTEAEFRTQLTAAVMGSGGLLLTDPLKELKRIPYRMKYVAKLLPVWPGAAQILDTFPDARYPSIYYTRIEAGFENYLLLGLINWDDRIRDFDVELDKILDHHREYHAFSFFEEKPGKISNGRLCVKGITAHDSRLIAIREKQPRPQIISTSMHLVQGAVELADVKFADNTLHVAVRHFEQNDAKLFLAVPAGWQKEKIETNAVSFAFEAFEPEYPVIRFSGAEDKRTQFKIYWKQTCRK